MNIKLQSTRRLFLAGAERFGELLDSRPSLLIVIMVLAYVSIVVPPAYFKPLWHDELYTYNLALSKSVAQMLQNVQRYDLNPPFLYLLNYEILRIPGISANDQVLSLAVRVPSILGGLLTSTGLFFFMRRRSGALYALVAVGLLWNTYFLKYVWEDRPYALLSGLLMLSILAWERATAPDRNPLWVGATLLLSIAMAGSHFIAAFLLAAFLITELVRTWYRRHADYLLLLSYVIPFAVLIVYRNKISNYQNTYFPVTFQPDIFTPMIAYLILVFFGSLMMLTLPFVRMLMGTNWPKEEIDLPGLSNAIQFARLEWVLILCILIEPIMAIVMIARAHGAFFQRYGLPACIPIAILMTRFFFIFFQAAKRAALCVLIVSASFALYYAQVIIIRESINPFQSVSVKSINNDYHDIESHLPFVAASGLTFVEMNHRESSEFLHRTYYLTDTPSAIKYAHATLFEGEAEISHLFDFQAKVESLKGFESANPKFLVLGTFDYPEDWLLRKLQADGDSLRYLGKFKTTYRDKDLYEVTIVPKDN